MTIRNPLAADRWRPILLAIVLVAGSGLAQAGASRFCDRQTALDAGQQDRIFRFSAIVKAQLEASGKRLALISRSGLDLQRFGVRYSHSGISLQASGNTPWAVRQLYFACDEQRPRIFDQGMSGFLLGMDDPAIGYLSLILLPVDAEPAVERSALDDQLALALLGGRYSANAYPFSERYQNCNQWLIEMLATAWGGFAVAGGLRPQAQAWLQAQGYRPTQFDLKFPPPAMLSLMVPLLHHDDHPIDDIDAMHMQVSMPASIEAFVAQRLPQARRIELCHNEYQVVIRHGWQPIADGCQPGPGDEVVSLGEPWK